MLVNLVKRYIFFFVGIFICMVYYANKKGRFNFMLYESHTIILHYILYLYIMNCSLSSCFYFLRVSIFFCFLFYFKIQQRHIWKRDNEKLFKATFILFTGENKNGRSVSCNLHKWMCTEKNFNLFVCFFFSIVIQKHGSYSLYLLLLFLYRVSDKMMK